MIQHNEHLFGVLFLVTMFGKNEVVTKALSLIQKLQHKYGFKPKFYEISSATVESDTPESYSPELYTPEPLERERLLPTISEEPENQYQVRIYCIIWPTLVNGHPLVTAILFIAAICLILWCPLL